MGIDNDTISLNLESVLKNRLCPLHKQDHQNNIK